MMARFETDKDHLMADATALVERAEFVRTSEADDAASCRTVTIGFRKDDSFSVYFDQDPFYQFDSAGLLRRSYENGFLYRSQTDTLARLNRQRSEAATTLLRSDLSPQELDRFRQRMRAHIENLLLLLRNGSLLRRRCISERGDIDQRTISFLDLILQHNDDFLSRAIRQRK